ncbi:MAG: TetR/AcrR family transcriptional regulator [Candidatus Limnocylindrales bacterium]
MPRTLDPAAHAVRRDAFVDAAERLIDTKGYQQLSVQEVLDALGASKGAFYHYFDSKAALLEAVVDRMADDALETVASLVADPNVPALAKLQGVFGGIARFKADRRELVLAVLDVWLSDDNAIVREKLRRIVVTRMVPVLAAILRQGAAEGMAPASTPEDTARVVASLIQGASDTAVELYVARQAGTVSFAVVERTLGAYAAAFERILGLPAGSLAFLSGETLHPWYD